MKSIFVMVLVVMMFILPVACADAGIVSTGQVHPSLPSLTLTVTDTGEQAPDGDHILRVAIEANDGGFSQELTWESIESPACERIVPLVSLKDMNFDGFHDLVLLTAQGARNVFFTLSLWNEEKGCFLPVEQNSRWDSEKQQFSRESDQLELCNYVLYPEEKRIVSSVADGYRFETTIVYAWESRYGLAVKALADIYHAGTGLIGETALLFGTGMIRCWNETYPEDWYYGQEDISRERRHSLHEIVLGKASWKPVQLQVANVDWVHLRKLDSKASPSLARLNEGEIVTLLTEGCGDENGWIRVWYDPGDGRGIFTSDPDDGSAMLTGYIWHSFLQPVDE